MTAVCCKCLQPIETGDAWYGLHPSCFTQWFKTTKLQEFSDIIPRSSSQIPLERHAKNTSFFHGAFRKYSSRLGNQNFILKVMQEGHPELPATEFVCNQIYEVLGVKIPNYYLIRYPEHHFCFVTKNFMSSLSNASLIHIYHYLKNKADYTCEKLVAIIGDKTQRRAEQERFVYLTLVDSLIGNHDRHGRNLGFIQSPKGFSLAPFYDNPSFVGLDNSFMLGADLQPRGAIFTQNSQEPTIQDYITEWTRLGYQDVVQRFQQAVKLDKVHDIIYSSLLTDKRKAALFRLINQRGKAVCTM